MKYLALITFVIGSNCFASTYCGQDGSFTTDIFAAINQMPSKDQYNINAADNLISLGYVREVVDSLIGDGFGICFTTLPLERNEYGYYRYLVNIHARKGVTDKQHSFLFQNASVQALHGNRRAPWTGVSTSLVQETNQSVRRNAVLATVSPEQDIYEAVLNSAFKPSGPYKAMGYILLDASTKTYLVGWMVEKGWDIYTSFSINENAIVQLSDDGVRLAPGVSTFNQYLVPLNSNLRDVQPHDASGFEARIHALGN